MHPVSPFFSMYQRNISKLDNGLLLYSPFGITHSSPRRASIVMRAGQGIHPYRAPSMHMKYGLHSSIPSRQSASTSPRCACSSVTPNRRSTSCTLTPMSSAFYLFRGKTLRMRTAPLWDVKERPFPLSAFYQKEKSEPPGRRSRTRRPRREENLLDIPPDCAKQGYGGHTFPG